MLTITKEFSFHAAHRLHLRDRSDAENLSIYGDCARLHGHTYRLQVCLAGRPDETGMILHFGELKNIVQREVLSRYDHADLNDLREYHDLPATAENMAEHIFTTLDRALVSDRFRLQQVTVFETPAAWATRSRSGGEHA
ncbi:6-carboxytetrahydropterin synthase [Desulfomicrobium sp. ZS1]|jgi:6-pyruvoyltetrahydropterin/6-carboxytetrahydropterin synthase|uniref:6-pyruvoyl trahydropterin synthase family protein n=1 Tax=Desulfomicrobium sp. ZS1 TaxID=2952228 RepID=UPI0020B3B8AC|nr:6-carboxytetrahydropterin synthase [Desulfomicrobium sp. ZS1]UTF51272.1 6-carboxytetrahydropterin synthase [Desulfomicrobium sp. ZS1]